MFKLVEDDTLTATVDCEYKTRAGSKLITLDIEFERLDAEQTDLLLQAARVNDVRGIGAVVSTVLVSWSGFKDHEGNAIAFTDEHVKQLTNDTQLTIATGAAIIRESTGGARAKNSRAQRGGGPK